MAEFLTSTDIGNRAAQHCGAELMDAVLGFSEVSKVARQISFVYGKLRRAELQERVWTFATRRALLRPVDATFMQLAPALWSASTPYFNGSIVADDTGVLWISSQPDNLNNQPGSSSFWDLYFGPMAIPPWDTTGTTAYFPGDVVYVPGTSGAYSVYLSLIGSNADNPATVTAYDATVTYAQDSIVTFNSVAYQSLIDLNLNNAPNLVPAAWTTVVTRGTGSTNWLLLGCALSELIFTYPVGSGPSTQNATANAYRLPANYLRKAPQNPKLPVAFLGGPSGNTYDDWQFEGNFLITSQSDPIIFRFVADFTDVTRMHDMFCEGLAARIAAAVAEPLTQSSAKVATIEKAYDRYMGAARTANAIEEEYQDAPDDEFISVRA